MSRTHRPQTLSAVPRTSLLPKYHLLLGPSADIQDSHGGTIPIPNGDSTLPGDQPDRNPQHFAQ